MNGLALQRSCNRGHVPIAYQGVGACPLCMALGHDGDPSFSDFWEHVPIKAGKARAERVWRKLTPQERSHAYQGIQRYKMEHNRLLTFSRKGEFVPGVKYPEGWLRDKRWNDPPILSPEIVRRIPCNKCGIEGHDRDQGLLDPAAMLHERCKK